MPDDLDDLLRAAMKTLDEQVPSGYFEALPNQTLARLEGSSMQHGTPGTTTQKRDVAPPPVALEAKKERDEDSGLHDIRNLAQSTKQRLSSRRITQNPPMSDDDVLASSSGSWKNIALPQPARMVSLPELAELPSKQEVIAAEKAAKRAKKESKIEAKAEIEAPVAAAVAAEPAAPVIEQRTAFTLPSQQRKSSKGPLLAFLGVGVAAAAGAVIFMQVNKGDQAASMAPATQAATTDTVTATPLPEKAPEPVAAAAAVAAGSAAPVEAPVDDTKAAEAEAQQVAVADEGKDEPRAKAVKTGKPSKKGGKEEVEKAAKEPETKVEVKKPAPTGGGAKPDGEGEPSFDALLKEAGVDEKKEVKPKLEKKSLSGDDFKKAMAAVSGKAQGCYKGNQGTALVKLTVAPSGQVTKVSVTGQFAGTPEGACVESAVKGASFPPWDGGPQSFNYSYMLAD